MSEQPERPRFIERRDPGEPVSRQSRSSAMLAGGVVALVLGLIGVLGAGSMAGLVVAILGAGLVVGGLVIRA
ncbi:MAG: hypothetical protein HOV76_32405 [Hamadaea sp.]|nr:hypothetical protein [Catenulispora sp.]NUT08180.1 hypothetical protein [Hamadaea sp.]